MNPGSNRWSLHCFPMPQSTRNSSGPGCRNRSLTGKESHTMIDWSSKSFRVGRPRMRLARSWMAPHWPM